MEVKKQGKFLVITVPLHDAKDAPMSKSGKSRVLFTSGGFQAEGGLRVNLTVIPA